MGGIVFSETVQLIFFMIIGMFLSKRGKYTASVNLFIGYLLTNVALPAAIINSFQVEKTPELLRMIRWTMVFSLVMLLLTLLFGFLISKILGKKGVLRRLWINCLLFSNILFIGIPIVDRLYGEEGLIVLVIYNTFTSLFLFTIGIMIFSNSREFKLKSLYTTPPIIASIIGYLLFKFGIVLPETINIFNSTLGGLTAPLAMIINGCLFVQNDFKKIIFNKDNLQFTIARVIGVPLFFILILQFFVKDPIILGVLTLVSAMPTGSLNAILAEEYAGEGAKVSQYIALTTIVSMVTLPMVMSFV
ncbi:AEC family transporter [Vagococcus vulneris]|uniref:Transporter n=1 Tax=Vagococcus vulneris TaxID=1977869 RepID=A0A430A1K4_9ENTE|nr:AEC family transporter [Vagococcus vulneris]RSU00278.1 hypothetical protein CBF37_02985 [Vagococcus vulneris]